MTRKLTLSITNLKALERGKRYARRQGKSLSRLVEGFLGSLPETNLTDDIDPELEKLSGQIKLPSGMSYDKLRRDALSKKFRL